MRAVLPLLGGSLSRPYPFRSFSREPEHRKNGKIRAREVRVIDEDKQPLGVMPLTDALRLAQNRRMDLIEVAPNAVPPVCRIMEYGKFKYEESKKKTDLKGRQTTNLTKELQLSANIDAHDFQVKLTHAIDFLSEGMKVRVKLRFRGRQKAHKEFGFEVVNRLIRETAAFGKPDTQPKLADKGDLQVLISPLPKDQRGKRPPAPIAGAATASAPKPSTASSPRVPPAEVVRPIPEPAKPDPEVDDGIPPAP